MTSSTTTQDTAKAIKISAKNFNAILAAAREQIGLDAQPCNDNKVRVYRSFSSAATGVWEICRVKGAYTFRRII